MNLHYIDLFIVCSYLVLCLTIGMSKIKHVKTLKDFASYKDISLSALICTLIASSTGVGSTIGITEKIYLFGIIYTIRQLFQPLFWLLSAYIIAPNIERFKGCLTIGDIMNDLYGSTGRWITSCASVLFIIGSLSMQITAMGYVFQYFFGIKAIYGSILGTAILTTYSVFGGMRSVIITEIFKFAVFILIIPSSCIIAMIKVGGIENIINNLPLSHLEFKVTQDNILLIISFVIYAFLPSFNPESVQRYLMAKNSQQLKNSFKSAFAFSIIISLSIATIAYIVKASGYNGNSQEALLYFIQEFLPIGLQGLMVAGLLAIFMSKAESSVTATSVIIVNDIAKSLFPNMSDASQLLLLRATIIILTFTSISMISSADHLIDIFWFARNFWDPIIFIPITAGFLGFRSNYISFLSSTVCALIATVLGRLYTGEFATISYGFGILGSMFGFFSAHYTQIALGHIIQKAQIQNKITIFTKIANSANHFTNRVKAQLNKKQQNKPKYNEFCILVMISLSIYAVYFVITKSSPVIAVVFLIGYFLALLFLLRDGLFPAHLVKKCFTAYWYFLLTYCLPFTAGCFLFFSQDNIFWLLSGVMAIFALSFFVDSFRFILLNTIGIALAYILYIIVHSTCHFALLGNITYLYLFIFLATLYFLRSREIEQEQKLETMKIFSGAIAHEVKNPLASLNMSAQTITAILESTQYKEHDGKIMLELNKDEFAFLKNVSKALETVSNNSVATVDNLLESIKNHTSTEDKRVYKISEVIKITLDEYTHNKFIELNITDDFSFYGSLKNVKHLLLNLLCNANKHGGDDVHISITTKDHKLFFKDHGKGISAEDTTKIFDSFYTKSKSGTGIGLAFCKMVIEEMGGNIECHSEVGRYTEFVITFG